MNKTANENLYAHQSISYVLLLMARRRVLCGVLADRVPLHRPSSTESRSKTAPSVATHTKTNDRQVK